MCAPQRLATHHHRMRSAASWARCAPCTPHCPTLQPRLWVLAVVGRRVTASLASTGTCRSSHRPSRAPCAPAHTDHGPHRRSRVCRAPFERPTLAEPARPGPRDGDMGGRGWRGGGRLPAARRRGGLCAGGAPAPQRARPDGRGDQPELPRGDTGCARASGAAAAVEGGGAAGAACCLCACLPACLPGCRGHQGGASTAPSCLVLQPDLRVDTAARSTHPLAPLARLASGSEPRAKDAPCIVLPHQTDYVSHIALDIGGWEGGGWVGRGATGVDSRQSSGGAASERQTPLRPPHARPPHACALQGGSLVKLIYFSWEGEEEAADGDAVPAPTAAAAAVAGAPANVQPRTHYGGGLPAATRVHPQLASPPISDGGRPLACACPPTRLPAPLPPRQAPLC